MKILAINGSPKGASSNTDQIVKAFLEGAELCGANSQIIYLKEKNVKPCIGCFSCWNKTPGKCVLNDDMNDLLKKVSEADVLVFASPLYYFNVTAIMKLFIDRLLPLEYGGYISEKDENYMLNSKNKLRQNVLISNCGFPGIDNFSGLVETFKVMKNYPLSATILRTQGELLSQPDLKDFFAQYINTVKTAGSEFVNQGYISSRTQSILNKDLVDPNLYSKIADNHLHAKQ